MGANPLAWSDIDGWSRLTGNRLSEFELQAIRQLDAKRIEWLNKSESERKALMPATPKALAETFRSLAGTPGKPQPAKAKKREA